MTFDHTLASKLIYKMILVTNFGCSHTRSLLLLFPGNAFNFFNQKTFKEKEKAFSNVHNTRYVPYVTVPSSQRATNSNIY